MLISFYSGEEMLVTYILFTISTIYLAFTIWEYKYVVEHGEAHHYKPLLLICMLIAFAIALYSVLTSTPYDKVVPWFN